MTNIKFITLLFFVMLISAGVSLAQDKKKQAAQKQDSVQNAAAEGKVGKILFSQDVLKKEVVKGETYVEEYELGKPLYARASFEMPAERKGKLSIRFTTDGQTFAEEDMREVWQNWDSRNQNAGSAGTAYFASGNSAGIRLVSEEKLYDRYVWEGMYALAEEAFRMHLSRLKDKIKVGKTVTVKVEVFMTERFGKNDKDKDGAVLATGDLKVKVTNYSKDLTNMVCRCGEEGMKNGKVEKEVSEGFKFGYKDHCAKVHQVVIMDRDWQIVNDKRTGIVKGRFVGASVVWETKEGDYWVARHNFYFPYDGAKFAEKAQLDKFIFKAPTAKLCSGK
jgi:hypothetical protein